MAATVPVFLKHTHISKALQEKPFTARAHSRYVQRQSATHSTHVHLMPESYNARQRWFFDHENGLRKNGRVIDKFTITIPYDIKPEDAATALDRFGKRMGQERCPFMFTIQGVDSRNYHAHYVFIDRDFETGKRVFGTTEYNSSRGIKLEWESAANEVFEELGYGVRVKVHEWTPELDAANDNSLDDTDVAQQDDIEADSLEPPFDVDTVDAPEEDDMAVPAKIETTALEAYEGTPHGFHTRELFRTVTELNRKHDAEKRLQEAERRYALATKARENTSIAASAHFVHVEKARQTAYQAKQDLQAHINGKGKLKGFKLLGFRTPGRKQAEQAQDRAERAEVAATYHAKEQEGYDYNAQLAETREQEAERETFVRRNELLDLYGDTQDLARAEEVMQNTIKAHLHEINKAGTTVEQMAEAMFNDEITADEFRTYLIQSGQEALLTAYDMGMEDTSEGLEEN